VAGILRRIQNEAATAAQGIYRCSARPQRAQVVHFFAEDRARVTADRDDARPAAREALRGADREELLRLAEAHVGTAASRRQSVSTRFRIILYDSIGGLGRRQ